MAEDNHSSPQNERDFFTDLMFGAAPEPEKPTEDIQQQQESPQQTEVDPSQFAQILTLIETLGPTIKKVAPVVGGIYSYIKKHIGSSDKDNTSS